MERSLAQSACPDDAPELIPVTDRAPDIRVLFEFNGTRRTPAADGYRPLHPVMDGCLTTGAHHYEGVHEVPPDGTAKGTITFISPESYPHCLRVGQVLPVQEGRRVVGRATILAILNPLLDADASP